MGPGLYFDTSLLQKLFILTLLEFKKDTLKNICSVLFHSDTSSLSQHFSQIIFGVGFDLSTSWRYCLKAP